MLTEYKGGKLTWIDAENPTTEEARELLLNYGFPPSLMNDLSTSGARDNVCMDSGTIKATLHFPIVKRTDIDHPHEVKFIIGKSVLLTSRYEDMEAIHRFQKQFEVIGTLYKTKRQANGAHLFFSLLREFYNVLDAKLDYLETRMRDIEREIFSAREKEMVFSISEVSRKLITYRQTVSSHTDELNALASHLEKCFGVKTAEQFANLIEQQSAIVRRTNGLFDTLDGLQNTNLAMLSTKQNEIVKNLTIVAFVTLPLTLIASLFNMSTTHTPIVGLSGDFWIILAIMTGGAIALFGFFKYKHWL
jgi:magnesium transporter